MIELAAFFGNPGKEHAGNRHNVGWLLAEKMDIYESLQWRKKFRGLWAFMDDVQFLMPQTYMNLSGESVFEASSFFKIAPQKIIVIHDELELPLGTVSLKFGGGLGGHNGLRSMKAVFATADFWRLRMGIGRPDSRLPGQGGPEGSGRGIYEWVLSDFTEQEWEILGPAIDAAAQLLQKTFANEPEGFLPEWSKKKITPVTENPKEPE